jgi:hypothetical protein
MQETRQQIWELKMLKGCFEHMEYFLWNNEVPFEVGTDIEA